MSNSIVIRVLSTFEIKVFVFVVINKVLNIMNIFVDLQILFFGFKNGIDARFFANFFALETTFKELKQLAINYVKIFS